MDRLPWSIEKVFGKVWREEFLLCSRRLRTCSLIKTGNKNNLQAFLFWRLTFLVSCDKKTVEKWAPCPCTVAHACSLYAHVFILTREISHSSNCRCGLAWNLVSDGSLSTLNHRVSCVYQKYNAFLWTCCLHSFSVPFLRYILQSMLVGTSWLTRPPLLYYLILSCGNCPSSLR